MPEERVVFDLCAVSFVVVVIGGDDLKGTYRAI